MSIIQSASLFSLTLRDLPDFSDPQAVSIQIDLSIDISIWLFLHIYQSLSNTNCKNNMFYFFLRFLKNYFGCARVSWIVCVRIFDWGRRAEHIDIVDDTEERMENHENFLPRAQILFFFTAFPFLRGDTGHQCMTLCWWSPIYMILQHKGSHVIHLLGWVSL